MKIDYVKINNAYMPPLSENGSEKCVEKGAASGDRVQISEEGSKINSAASGTEKTSAANERGNRIAGIKKLVDSGQYHISSGEVAKRILRG